MDKTIKFNLKTEKWVLLAPDLKRKGKGRGLNERAREREREREREERRGGTPDT